MTEILVADDDGHVRELVRLCLERAGFGVREAASGREALESLEATPADLLVVDIMMPSMDGWELCRAVRGAGDTPILMLTARSGTGDKVRGLALGADDYLVKPFEPEELVARVRALCRRYRIATSQVVAVGALRLDRTAYSAWAGGERLSLPRKEFELLFRLMRDVGRTRTREDLIEQVWGYDYAGDERTVDVHIGRLRARFPEDRYGFRIRTIRGLGYRLEAVG